MSDSLETSEDMARPFMGELPVDSASVSPIERAVQLLREVAAEIAQSVSISDVPDWANEPDSKAAHDEALIIARHLEALAPTHAVVLCSEAEAEIAGLAETLRRARAYVLHASTSYYDGTDGVSTRQNAKALLAQIDAALEASKQEAQGGQVPDWTALGEVGAAAYHHQSDEDGVLTRMHPWAYAAKKIIEAHGNLAATPATPAQAERVPVEYLHRFMGKGSGIVRRFYNGEDQSVVDAGAWIQEANQLLQLLAASPPAPQPERVALTPVPLDTIREWAKRRASALGPEGVTDPVAFLEEGVRWRESHGIGTSATKEGA